MDEKRRRKKPHQNITFIYFALPLLVLQQILYFIIHFRYIILKLSFFPFSQGIFFPFFTKKSIQHHPTIATHYFQPQPKLVTKSIQTITKLG